MSDHGCGIVVTIEDGRPVALKGSAEHPFNKGWLCTKGRRALDLSYSPHRLSSPLIRSKGRLVPATWEEANANKLTGLENVDQVSGFPNLKSLRCLVRRL